jgi:hypothetical protein
MVMYALLLFLILPIALEMPMLFDKVREVWRPIMNGEAIAIGIPELKLEI